MRIIDDDPKFSYSALSWVLALMRVNIDKGSTKDIREEIERATGRRIHPSNFVKIKNWMVKYGILEKVGFEYRKTGDYGAVKRVNIYKINHDYLDYLVFTRWSKTTILFDRAHRWASRPIKR